MKHSRKYFWKHFGIAFIATIFLATAGVLQYYPQFFSYLDRIYSYAGQNLAAVLTHNTVTIAKLQSAYNDAPQKRVRILLVPGHEPNYGGAEYKDLKERNMTVELAQDLQGFLDQNNHYQVLVTRDQNAWNPTFADYFANNWQSIISWEKLARQKTSTVVSVDSTPVVSSGTIRHNVAPEDVALRLYGITKWANENDIDIEIHIHFNDNPGHPTTEPGKYSGFAIYVPAGQYDNSSTTKAVATSVFKRLAKYNAVSNLPGESDGIVDEPELIAIGANNTADAASMLIEYGYIYEPQFADPAVRSSTIKDLAFQTYLGLQDFFGSGNDFSFAYDTLMLPHSWKAPLTKDSASADDALALQSALLLDGDFPSEGLTKNDCPRTGKIGPCTLNALSAFQKKYNITGEKGIVGEKTIKVLNDKYSVKVL